ncbi:MAG TPA: PPC domain-containing protein [Planctomycetaceae bacterium]|nr:PPC domain-containing protein [Planctomycetaceae bacterium]
MNRFKTHPVLCLALVLVVASSAQAQNQYIGYVYPAGGQQGTTFSIRLGGQSLVDASDVVVSGDGVSVRLIDYYRVMNNQEMGLLRQQLNELKKKESTIDDAMISRMSMLELPATILPPGTEPSKAAAPPSDPPPTEQDIAKQKLIERIESRFAEDERTAAVRAHTELVFAEVTVDPGATPGRREIRVITKRGISNALSFYVGQVPEVVRQPMKTSQLPVLGKEELAQRKRPPQEEEVKVTIPCTTNGQIAPGEMNRYRFQANKGQRLVITAKARELNPYVADGVPGWFQAVLKLQDSAGREVAYNDDYRSDPDPVLDFEVPADGEYVLTINEALFRGRESFVYRITIGELPFVTSIFPLGGRVGEPVKIEMAGWNLEQATLTPPPADAPPGTTTLTASNATYVSNTVPFVLGTLPECLDVEPNNEPAQAQKISLPMIINGRADQPGDWDVFEVEGKAGQTIVAEVQARRLGSPLDSFLKVTGPNGNVIALNDDHFDAASGANTDHADSYLMATLPSDGTYFVHLGNTRQDGGAVFAYRLRISPPQPDFELRLLPSRIVIRSKNSAAVTVYAIRRDGFTGPIQLNFENLPEGFESGGATLAADTEVVSLALKTSLTETEQPVNLTVVGRATVGDQEIRHQAVPTEDKMQAFLWRHLLPAEDLPVVVFDPAWQPLAERIRPLIRDEDRPKDVTRNLQKSSVDWYLRQIEGVYQEWFFTDEFANREIANIEARLIAD